MSVPNMSLDTRTSAADLTASLVMYVVHAVVVAGSVVNTTTTSTAIIRGLLNHESTLPLYFTGRAK